VYVVSAEISRCFALFLAVFRCFLASSTGRFHHSSSADCKTSQRLAFSANAKV
jgi:hypothetical protein